MLTMNDAQMLVLFISAVLIPFAVNWLKVVTWPAEAKFALAAGLSLVAGYLSTIAAGSLIPDGTLIQNATIILATAQGIYYVGFKALGLEKVLFPKQALVSAAKDEVAEQVDTKVSSNTAKEILDSNVSTALNVNADVVSTPTATSIT